MLSEAAADTVAVLETVAPATGDERFTAGNVASYVAVRAAEPVLPAASRAVVDPDFVDAALEVFVPDAVAADPQGTGRGRDRAADGLTADERTVDVEL